MKDLISRQWLTECVNEGWIKFDTEKDKNRFIHLVRDIAPPTPPEYEPVTAEDFAKMMSETTVYSFMKWHGMYLTLMKEYGFVICKKMI